MTTKHLESILCPNCGKICAATVEHTKPFWTYIHICKCGYTIMESKWNRVNDGDCG